MCNNQLSIIATGQGLAFGDIAAPAAGSVTVDVNGLRTASGGVVLLGGTPSSATFDVTGCANSSYSIGLPASTTLASGANSMVLDTFVSSPSGTGTLDATGYQELRVGATLNLSANQPAGNYSGTFAVDVIFN